MERQERTPHSTAGINYSQRSISASAVTVSHLSYLWAVGLKLWTKLFSEPPSLHVLCFFLPASDWRCVEDGCLATEKWLREEEFAGLGQTKKAINLYHKADSQRMLEVALLCSEAPCKCKQNPRLLLATGCFSESDQVLEWKQSSSDVNVPMGSKHLF